MHDRLLISVLLCVKSLRLQHFVDGKPTTEHPDPVAADSGERRCSHKAPVERVCSVEGEDRPDTTQHSQEQLATEALLHLAQQQSEDSRQLQLSGYIIHNNDSITNNNLHRCDWTHLQPHRRQWRRLMQAHVFTRFFFDERLALDMAYSAIYEWLQFCFEAGKTTAKVFHC